jgi:hypothetical protein
VSNKKTDGIDEVEAAKRKVATYLLDAPAYKFSARNVADALGWRVEKLTVFWRDCDKKSKRKKVSL